MPTKLSSKVSRYEEQLFNPEFERVTKPFVVACTAAREVKIIDEAFRELAPNEVRIRTLYSGISTGTELTTYRGTNPCLQQSWDADHRLFKPGANSLEYPVLNWGYEEVGEVIEVGAEAVALPIGTTVFGTWGHRSEHIAEVNWARDRVLPNHCDPLYGIFSHIGAIALNGVIDSGLRLTECVAVFGLGVVGQLVGQLCKLSGATVIGVDKMPIRLEVAKHCGFDYVINASEGSAAEQIKSLTSGAGADVVFEASGFYPALQEAIRAAAYSSKVVALGFYQGNAEGLRLGEEFHHNRINLVCSQISGSSPELQHRWNRLRLIQSFMGLVCAGKLKLDPLITHVMPVADADAMFKVIDGNSHNVLQAVLNFKGTGSGTGNNGTAWSEGGR
jgi:2-desacetyl-2-hydroxyethyl bacteriochlorophyllide A dehydrogenase